MNTCAVDVNLRVVFTPCEQRYREPSGHRGVRCPSQHVDHRGRRHHPSPAARGRGGHGRLDRGRGAQLRRCLRRRDERHHRHRRPAGPGRVPRAGHHAGRGRRRHPDPAGAGRLLQARPRRGPRRPHRRRPARGLPGGCTGGVPRVGRPGRGGGAQRCAAGPVRRARLRLHRRALRGGAWPVTPTSWPATGRVRARLLEMLGQSLLAGCAAGRAGRGRRAGGLAAAAHADRRPAAGGPGRGHWRLLDLAHPQPGDDEDIAAARPRRRRPAGPRCCALWRGREAVVGPPRPWWDAAASHRRAARAAELGAGPAGAPGRHRGAPGASSCCGPTRTPSPLADVRRWRRWPSSPRAPGRSSSRRCVPGCCTTVAARRWPPLCSCTRRPCATAWPSFASCTATGWRTRGPSSSSPSPWPDCEAGRVGSSVVG